MLIQTEDDEPTACITVGCPYLCHEGILGRESRDPNILKLVSKWEWAYLAYVRFTPVLIQ
jgi:hypothetical protein